MSSSSPIRFLTIKLNEPSVIGFLASLALHSLLFAFPGIILFEAQESRPKARFTRVVTLSSQEQKRLPQLFSQDIPEFPDTAIINNPLLSDKPAFEPSEPSQKSLLLPAPPAPPLPALPPTNNPFQVSTNITKPPIGNTSLPKPLLPPPPASTKTPAPPQTSSSEAATKSKPETPQNQANITKTKTDPDNPSNRTFPDLPEASTPPIAIKPETANSDRIAKLTPEEQKLIATIRKARQIRPQKQPKTTDEEAKRNYDNWLARVQKQETEELTFNATYPQDACLRKVEGTNVYGVLVDPQGRAIRLELIKGSGYRAFNEHGVEEIFERTFKNNTQQTQPYLVSVKFTYDAGICSLPKVSARDNQNPRPTQKKPLPLLPPNPGAASKKPTSIPTENNATPASGPLETTKKPTRSIQELIAPTNSTNSNNSTDSTGSNTPPHRTLPENFQGINAPSNRAPIIFREQPKAKAAKDAPENGPASESTSETK